MGPVWDFTEPPVCTVDGKIDFTEEQLRNWDADGDGSTFATVYGKESHELALFHNFDLTRPPRPVTRLPEHTHLAEELLGYRAEYSFRNVLEELRRWGAVGPPPASIDAAVEAHGDASL